MTYDAPPLPTMSDWRSIGVRVADELHAGKQSRVFAATIDEEAVALKLTDAALVDRDVLTERMRVMEMLAVGDGSASDRSAGDGSAGDGPDVVCPVRLDGELVHRSGGWLVTATRFVDGTRLVSTTAEDARVMGQALAALHRQLAELPTFAIPPVAALRADRDTAGRPEASMQTQPGWQLLHADFSDANIIRVQDGLRIIDFDDCGYGPIEYDLANLLYMVLFDAQTNDRPDHYLVFRPAFLDGYARAAGRSTDAEAIDLMIDVRVDALDRWLGDLSTAPIGIRTAPPAWHVTLRDFVASYRSGRRPNTP